MGKHSTGEGDVFRFLASQIDSVPHLEGLLLVWRSRPTLWKSGDLAAKLFVSPEEAGKIALDLCRRGLLSARDMEPPVVWYEQDGGERDALMEALAEVYRRDLIKVARFIHSKQDRMLHDFADAFRIRKDQR